MEPLALLAGAGASVTSMIIGSYFGDSGTLVGAASGSVVYGVTATWYENFAARAHARMRRGKDPDATTIIPVAQYRKHKRLALALSGIALALVSCGAAYAVLGMAEAASGKTLHGLITNSADYGSSWTHEKTPPPSAPSQRPGQQSGSPDSTSASTRPSVSYSPPASVVEPSVTPSLSPTPVMPTVTGSPVPDPTGSF